MKSYGANVFLGFWSIDVPLSTEEAEEDRLILDQITMPADVTVIDMSVVIHGRVWKWTTP